MDELDFDTIIANGYTVDDLGAIFKDGQYLESVTIDGKTRYSGATQEQAEFYKYRMEALDEANFMPDLESNTPVHQQQRNALVRVKVEQYIQDPTSVVLTQDEIESPVAQMVYEEEKQKAKEEEKAMSPTLKGKVQAEEQGTIYMDMEEDEKIQYNHLIKEREKILTQDSTTERDLENLSAAVKTSSVSGVGAIDFASDVVGKLSTIIPDDWGMESKVNKKKLEKINAEIATLEKPAQEKQLKVLDKKIAEIEALQEQKVKEISQRGSDISKTDTDFLAYQIAKERLETQRNIIQDHINGSYIDSNIFTLKTGRSLATAGLYDLATEVPMIMSLKKSIERGEELTPGQQALADSYLSEAELGRLKIKPNWSQELSGGLVHSIGFLIGGGTGRAIGTKASKAIRGNVTRQMAKETSKKAVVLYNTKATAGAVADVGIQAVVHPSTYLSAADKYSGNIYLDDEGKITTDGHTHATLLKEYNGYLDEYKEILSATDNPEIIAKLQANIKGTEELITNLEDNAPPGLLKAGAYGFVETAKEALAETYFSPMMKGFGKFGGQMASKTKIGKFIQESKLNDFMLGDSKIKRGFNWLNNTNSKLRSKFNQTFGGRMPGKDLIGSNLEEFGEEVFVQFLPTVGEEYDFEKRVEDTFNWHFVSQVAAQTLIMGQGAKAIGKVSSFDYKDYIQSKSNKRKQIKLLKKLTNSNLTEEQFSNAFMATGEGKFSMQDYNNTIKEMRDAGDILGANKYEQDKLYKQTLAAAENGTLTEFMFAMQESMDNKNLSAETRANLGVMFNRAIEIKEVQKKYKNSGAVLDLMAKKEFATNSYIGLSKEAEKATPEEITEINNALEKEGATMGDFRATEKVKSPEELLNISENIKGRVSSKAYNYFMSTLMAEDMHDNIKEVEKLLENATSIETQEAVGIKQDYLKFFNSYNNKNYNGEMTSEKYTEDGYKEVQEAYEKKTGKKLPTAILGDLTTGVNALLDAREQYIKSVEEASKSTPVEAIEKGEQAVEQASIEAMSTINSSLSQIPKENIIIEDSPFAEEGDFENEPDFMMGAVSSDEGSIQALQNWANIFEHNMGRKPTFRDFWSSIIKIQKGNKATWNKYSLEGVGKQWEKGGLGDSGWADIWTSEYTNLDTITAAVFANNPIFHTNPNETQEQVTKNTEKKEVIEASKGPVNPITNKALPVKKKEEVKEKPLDIGKELTVNKGKTTVTSTKGNYSSVKYDVDKNKSAKDTYYDKVDRDKGVPTIKEKGVDTPLNIKELLNPEKNQPGDKLGIRITTEKDWDNPLIFVSDVNENGTLKGVMTFSQWIKKYKPSNMTLEEFQTTDTFKAKVPIFYTDAQGNDLMYVPDADWYNPLSILDSTKEVDEKGNEVPRTIVDINNPSVGLQYAIDSGKSSANEMRNKIFNDGVSEVEITSKRGSMFITIPKADKNGVPIPLKKLKDVASDNPVFTYNELGFKGINNKPLGDKVVILNQSEIELNYLRKQRASKGKISDQVVYLSPEYTLNGVKFYKAFLVTTQNDQNTSEAYSEDITTAKVILAAYEALHHNKTIQNFMTPEEAKSLRKTVMKETGLDIANNQAVNNFIFSMIRLKDNSTGLIYTPMQNGKIPLKGKNVFFIDALFSGQFEILQNVRVKDNSTIFNATPKLDDKGVAMRDSKGFVIYDIEKFENKEGKMSYDTYLKNRLKTNVMGYNMGTEENPKFTHSIQPIIQVKPIESESKIVKTEQQKEKTELKSDIEEIPVEPVEDTGVTQEELNSVQEAEELLRSLNALNQFESEADSMTPMLEGTELIEEAMGTVSGLTNKSQQEVIKSLAVTLTTEFSNKKEHTAGSLNKEVKDKFLATYLKNDRDLHKQRENLEKLVEKYPDQNKFNFLLANVRAAMIDNGKVIDNFETLFQATVLKVKKEGLIKIKGDFKDISDVEKEVLEHHEEAQLEKNFYKSSNEDIHKNKISAELKRIFYNINVGRTGFMGIPIPENYDTIYNSLATYFSTIPGLEPTFNGMMAELEKLDPDKNGWVFPLIEKLKVASKETQAGFVSNMYKYSANARFVMFIKSKNGVESAVWFSNANNLQQKIKDSWINNFKRSSIVSDSKLNTERLGELADQYSENKSSWAKGENKEDAREWLSNFGIVLTDQTWDAIIKGNFVVPSTKEGMQEISYERMFISPASGRSIELFDSLFKYAEQHRNGKDLDFVKDTDLIPFAEMSNIMKGLIPLESKYNKTLMNITRRDGDKTVSEIIYPSYYLDNISKLISSANGDKSYLEQLQNLPFSQSSMLLELLMDNPSMASIFNYGEVGLMSMKNRYDSAPNRANIDQISAIDHLFHQRAMFQDTKVEKLNQSMDMFTLRVATMSTPTNSDKGRMMLMKTAVYDLYGAGHLAFDTSTDNLEFVEETKELIYKRLVEPELDRIIAHQDKAIKGYDSGAKRFNVFPILNVLKGKSGVEAVKYLQENKGNKDIKETFKNEFFDEFTKEIESNIQNEVDGNLNVVDEYNIQNENDISVDHINDTKYLSKKKYDNNSKRRRAAELDYVINATIHNMNVMQTIAGDPATYFGKGDPLSTDRDTQLKLSKDLGTNMGKRMALMIAPGVTLAESVNEKYIQIFLDDNAVVAPNIENIIEVHYGKNALEDKFEGVTYRTLLEQLKDKTISKVNKEQLFLKFANVKAFMDIESTDGQEYTTLREHLRVMKGLGRISDEKINDILDKVSKGERLSKEDLQLVMQPMKPVYTGSQIEGDINRVYYVKCSSFPLIPDLVRGTELEPLMNKMNEIEEKHSSNEAFVGVRASYMSAVKVGGVGKNANGESLTINPLDERSLNQLDITDDGISPIGSTLLDRENFKIQQDVPFKSDKEGDDMVSMGTQIFKLLLGDGVSQIMDKNLEKGKVGIKEEFFNAFSTIVNHRKQELLDELGLDENYEPIDPEGFIKKLQDLLIKEAQERNFSENDIKSFGISQKKKKNGDVIYYFKQPLWFSGNSDKIESMLNAIINNRVFKQKMPGNAAVVGSNSGLTLREGAPVPNNIVHIGDYKGGVLQGNEVLAPSKIKLNGKLINLFEKTEDGEYINIIENNDGSFQINPERIDPQLFENFTFRTPTSSHGSGSSIKIVGFLPDTMGDLMITPSNFVAQMGQDFDIDKLTNYQYHHDLNGIRIEKLNQEIVDRKIARLEGQLPWIERAIEEIYNGKTPTDLLVKIKKLDELLDNFEGPREGSILESREAEYAKISKDPLVYYENKLDELDNRIAKMIASYELKLAQNKFIEIHNKVYQSTDPAIQKKINKVLSMDVADNQAEAIDTLNSAGDTTFNLLSPNYQMRKMISGSTGGDAIGIYAKGVTFNSIAQQSDKRLRLMQVIRTKEGPVSVEKKITIGDVSSNGEFGNFKNLSIDNATDTEKQLARSIAESLDERVNTGTDNEKAQILGRVGIIDTKNVAVDNLLAQLGIDLEIKVFGKGAEGLKLYDPKNKFHKKAIVGNETYYYTEYSLPYLLHSQPLVKEFFKRLGNSKSILGGTKGNLEQEIFEELIGKDFRYSEEDRKLLTGETMASQLGGSLDTKEQKIALTLYKELMEDAENLRKLQKLIDMSNLGKSMWESQEYIEEFKELAREDSDYNLTFLNTEDLLGTFNTNNEQGSLDLGGSIYFKPTTNQGVMVGTALSLGRNLFTDYYPYYDPYIKNTITDIAKESVLGDNFRAKEEIFQQAKKYITSNRINGVFTDNPNIERERLFLDTEDNTSLSSYISMILTIKNGTKGIKEIQNNPFIKSLTFVKGTNGEPSIVKFDNTAAGNVSEEDLYNSFRELLISEETITKDNKLYSVRELAQDLVIYSHVSGGIVSQAIEFHKFIPNEYYKQLTTKVVNTQGTVGEYSVERMMQTYDPRVVSWTSKNRLKHFKTQYFQNNPDKARTLPKKFYKVNEDKSLLEITNKKMREEDYPMYLRVNNYTKSAKKTDKNHLYVYTGNSVYKRIPVLGTFGMSEYDYENPIERSIIDSKLELKKAETTLVSQVSTVKPSAPKADFQFHQDDTMETAINRILTESTNVQAKEMMQILVDTFGSELYKIPLTFDLQSLAKGSYFPIKRTTEGGGNIALKFGEKDLDLTLVHELIHAVTSDYINEYVDSNDNLSPGYVPKEVREIYEVYKDYKDQLYEKYPGKYVDARTRLSRAKAGDKTVDFGLEEFDKAFYASHNLKEFLAVTLTNNEEFLKYASKMKYKGNINFVTKFQKVLKRLLNLISGSDTGNLAEKALTANLSYLEKMTRVFPAINQRVPGQKLSEIVYNLKKSDPNFNKTTPVVDDPTVPPTFGGFKIVKGDVEDIKDNEDVKEKNDKEDGKKEPPTFGGFKIAKDENMLDVSYVSPNDVYNLNEIPNIIEQTDNDIKPCE